MLDLDRILNCCTNKTINSLFLLFDCSLSAIICSTPHFCRAASVPGLPGKVRELLQMYFPALLERFAKVFPEVNGTMGR